jgi:hypothetical protein
MDGGDWLPSSDTACPGTDVEQTNSCGELKTVNGTRDSGSWTPLASTQCPGIDVHQTNACGSQTVDGEKSAGAWTPDSNTDCPGTDVAQTNACGGSQTVNGTSTNAACNPSYVWDFHSTGGIANDATGNNSVYTDRICPKATHLLNSESCPVFGVVEFCYTYTWVSNNGECTTLGEYGLCPGAPTIFTEQNYICE